MHRNNPKERHETEHNHVRHHWNKRYRETEKMWSGHVNASMAKAVKQLQLPSEIDGRAAQSLDIGCGEGADVCWLAERGFTALGIDVSTVAVERASEHARNKGIWNADFEVAHAESWLLQHAETGQKYNLITANFFHSHVQLDREAALLAAFDLLAPEGILLMVSHASMPSWYSSEPGHATPDTPTQDSELEIFSNVRHKARLAEVWERIATGPNGVADMHEDLVVAVQR